MVPGFLDGHSHFINSLSVASQANVYAPPFGPGDSIPGIVAALKDLQQKQTTFTGIAAHRIFGTSLAFKGQTESAEGVMVSGSYFSVLGLQPALGRLLGDTDDQVIGESHTVVLSHDYWTTRFGAVPAPRQSRR